MTSSAFHLQGVVKRYRVGESEIEILHRLDLEIPQGQYVAVMGPSGSGKSTLMQLLGCLDAPTEGAVAVFGQDTSTLPDDDLALLRRRRIGFVFQSFNLLPTYDALANAGLGLVYSGLANRDERAGSLLSGLGLGRRLHHRPRMMSGGEQQRVAIARALANDPPILLADEPTGALDQTNGQAVLQIFDDLHRQGKTIVLVTHDPLVAHRAQRVIEMVDGFIRRDGPPR